MTNKKLSKTRLITKNISKPTFNELVIACDFETQTLEKDKILSSYVIAFACKEVYYQLQTYKIEIEDTYEINNNIFYFDSINFDQSTIKKFFDYLFSFKNYSKINIFFHNLKNFDGFFLVPYLLENFKQITLETKLDNNQFYLLYVNSFLLNIKLKKDNIIFNFIDSLSFFPLTSLKNLGEIINLEKLEFNDNFFIEKEKPLLTTSYLKFVEYTKRDVEILAKFLLFFVKKTKINLLNSVSAAGISFNYFKQKYYQKGIYLTSQDKWEIIHQSYYGGFTYLNEKYALKLLDNLNYFDINSAYPDVLKRKLPYGDLEVYTNQKYGTKLFHIRILKLEVNELNIAIIRSKKYDERFIKKSSNAFIYYIWEFEIDYVKHFYKVFDYEIIETYWIKLKKIASEFIDHWYDIKQKNTKKENSTQKLFNYFSKVILNSLYGKFGEKLIRPERYYLDSKLLKNNQGQIKLFNKLYHIETIHQSKTFKNLVETTIMPIEPRIKKIKNNAIASYITAKVRTEIYKQILKFPDKFVYCDTDSIILKDAHLSNIYLSKDKLGLWKYEHKNVKGYFIKAKQYFLDSKNKMLFKTSGFQKLLTEFDFNTINSTTLEFVKISSKKSAYGVVLTPQKSELKEGKWKKIET